MDLNLAVINLLVILTTLYEQSPISIRIEETFKSIKIRATITEKVTEQAKCSSDTLFF